MALFQSTYTTMMHNPQEGQRQAGITLASAVPSAQSCTISELIAFPTSLAALKRGIKWNASCWTAKQRLNEFEQRQIGLYAFRGQQRTPHIEWCQFATDINETISMLIIFPELKTSFRSPEIMERWTDKVVLPAFRAVGASDGTLTSSFKVIQMTAEAEREQTLNDYAPDTTMTQVLSKKGGISPHDMHTMWAHIQENANRTSFFDGFKNLFLVAVFRQPDRSLRSLPMDEAWRSVTAVWDAIIDMNFVPPDSVRADASVTIIAQQIGNYVTAKDGGSGIGMVGRATIDSMWESSRKRRLDDDSDGDKRAKLDGSTSQMSASDEMEM
jgi:hypothetical protein